MKHGLSPKEQQVMGMIVEGMSNKDIAVKARISVQTVAVYISRLRRWFGATNSRHLVAIYYKRKIDELLGSTNQSKSATN